MNQRPEELFPSISKVWEENLYIYEREALCQLAGVSISRQSTPWDALSQHECEKLLFAFRRAIALGTTCASALLHGAALMRGPR